MFGMQPPRSSTSAITMAALSALCALGCIGTTLTAVAWLLSDWRTSLVLLGSAVQFGIAARVFDRWKLSLLFGSTDEPDDDADPGEEAMRQTAAYLGRDVTESGQ